MKKAASLVAVIAMMLIMLAGCSTSSKTADTDSVSYKMYIYGTQSCPYCQKMKALSTEMFGATNTVFIEINPAITGTQTTLNEFCSLASVLSSQGCNDTNIGTPIVVLANGNGKLLAVWDGFVEKEELQKIMDNATTQKPLYWPSGTEGFVSLKPESAQLVQTILDSNQSK
jgi:thioredoxin-related protein